MDIMDESLLGFWKTLNSFGVKYIMVGGVAVNLHGFSRMTKDIDIWINDTKENRIKLGLAFAQFGYEDLNLEDFQFIPGQTGFNIGSGLSLYVLIRMVGLEGYSFEECLEMASIAEIEGVSIPFLQINQLIANKKAVNRSKDQVDVIELENIIRVSKDLNPL